MIRKPIKKVLQWSLLPVAVTVLAMAIGPDFRWSQVHSRLLSAASSVIGTTALFLYWSEKHAGSRAVFLNFGIFFLANGVSGPLQSVISKWLGFLHRDMDTLLYQYSMSVYFLLLSICVVYLVIECMSRRSNVFGKYLMTVLVVGVAWGPLYYPYLSNPRYLHETEDMRDFRAVRKALDGLGSGDQPSQSARTIAAIANSTSVGDRSGSLTEARVMKILPYTRANDYAILFFRPIWRSCALISAFTVVLMIGFLTLRYFSDPPGSAYLEKIAWCTLLYSILEAIHHYYFMNAASWDTVVGFMRVGGFVSLAVMVTLGYLFGLRYIFVNSVEGLYYEKQLSREASRITRWRDIFDNWVLRRFVVESDLDRRFLVRGQGGEERDGEKEQKNAER